MSLPFVNRSRELAALDDCARSGGLVVVHGRRRLGKTRLLTRWLSGCEGLYSQAIEGGPELQLEQVYHDLAPGLETQLTPRTWEELFQIVDLQRGRTVLCIDEFPYLVSSDPSLPSRFQKWLDQGSRKRTLLILAGSSTRMMHDTFLSESAPLFGRARRVLRVDPMGYGDFCEATRLEERDMDSFLKFSMVGGVPRYWEFIRAGASAVGAAEELYFDFAPYMENEPRRLLRDEKVEGLSPQALLEVIGRGAERPSEMSSRLAIVQTSLSGLLQRLVGASILSREIPFGESERNAKRTCYKIADPSMRFWYRVYSPHRSLWRTYDRSQKENLLRGHAGLVFEDFCRQAHPGARRYWEKDIEIDMVRPDADSGDTRGVVVSEVKWKRVSSRERARILGELEIRWGNTRLAKIYPRARFELLDWETARGGTPAHPE